MLRQKREGKEMEEKFPYTYKREKQRFSIRKIKAWGACSVFLGTSILFLSAGTVARADTTADATVNTGSASKNPTVPVTSTDNSKKIKSLLVSNHLEEKDNLENVALSSNSVQPATSISDDTYLKKLGIDINDLNTNSVLKLASLFHIFANQASLSADTNGNLAVKILNGSNDFGTRGDSYNLTSGDIYYIQQLDKNLQSNAFRNITFNHVVLGKDVNVSIENNKVLINGITMDNLKPEDVYQDTTGQTYIDFSDVFQQLISSSTSYTSTTQSKGVNSNYSDMNNRYIDVSGVAAGTQIIYVNVPFEYLSDPQPITIKGISNSLTGPTIVINVTGIPDGNQNISTQVQFNYIHGTNPLPNSEGHTEPNHVLWNLGTGGQTFNFSSGRFMGSILAPNATINAGVNIDGNIVANIVNITGGESHRWDIHPQPTQPTKPVNPSQPTTPTQPMTHGTTQTTESKTIKEIIHYVYKDGTTAHDDYVTKPVKFTREVSTDAVTGEKTYGPWTADQSFAAVTSPAIKGYTPDSAEIESQTVSGDSSDLEFTVVYAKNVPTKPVNPSQPTTPTKPVNPSQPTTPTKPVNPSQPTTPTKPVNPSQPTTPTKPVQAGQAAAINFMNQRLPQTGETDQQHMTLSGLLLLAMSSLLGLFGMTKRQRKE